MSLSFTREIICKGTTIIRNLQILFFKKIHYLCGLLRIDILIGNTMIVHTRNQYNRLLTNPNYITYNRK